MNSRSHWAAALTLVAALLVCPFAQSNAIPVQTMPIPDLGAQLYSLGGKVTVEVLGSDLGYASELWVITEHGFQKFVANSDDVGRIINLGEYSKGEELLFAIRVLETDHKFFMGPGVRNPDAIEHATVLMVDGSQSADIGFEDQFGGGDRDYNDDLFQVRGSLSKSTLSQQQDAVPEPASLILFGAGLLSFAGLSRRLRRR